VPVPPNIVVVGSGFIGSSVVDLLMSNGLSSFLHVFCRGDLQAQQWRRRGLKSSPSMARLMKDAGKADIVIICTGLSGFTNTVKLLLPFISPATAVITSSFGLQRKRIYAAMQTVGVLRTYLEPHSLVKHVRQTAAAAGIDHGSFDDPALSASGGGLDPDHGGEQGGGDDDGSVGFLLDDASQEGTITDSLRTYKSADQFLFLSSSAAGSLANAADLLARRTPDIRNLVTVLENYYSLLGLRFLACRAHAMFAVLGHIEDTPVGHASVQLATATVGSASIDNMMRLRGKAESEDDDTEARDLYKEEAKKFARAIASLSQARASLEANVSYHFQRQLSKYIRVVDLPKLAPFLSQDDRRSVRKSTLRKSQNLEAAAAGAGAAGSPGKVASGHHFEPAAPAAPPVGHGSNATMHPDKAILHIFSRDTKYNSPLWMQLDADNDGSSLASMGTHDDLFDTDGGGLDSLEEVSSSSHAAGAAGRKLDLRGFDGEDAAGGVGGNIDASVLLAIELANAHKRTKE